jgi:hypothetical protein
VRASSWQRWAACRGSEAALFFSPELKESAGCRQAREATATAKNTAAAKKAPAAKKTVGGAAKKTAAEKTTAKKSAPKKSAS